MKNIYEWWLTACVYFEARGECFEGQKAIVQVVLNRAIRRQQSIIEVIQAEQQFTWYNGGDEPPVDDWAAFIHCMDAVDATINARYNGDTLHHADHYHGDYMEPFPSWVTDMRLVAHIGQHLFYRS